MCFLIETALSVENVAGSEVFSKFFVQTSEPSKGRISIAVSWSRRRVSISVAKKKKKKEKMEKKNSKTCTSSTQKEKKDSLFLREMIKKKKWNIIVQNKSG